MTRLLCTLVTVAFSVAAYADEAPKTFDVSVEIPKLNVSEYHRPYIAVWIQDSNRKAVANIAVWYQMKDSKEGAGTKWLPDLRQWWRRSGRSLEMPVDGVSGASRPAGKHTISLPVSDSRFKVLSAGKYELIVEASREVGGREVVSIPFQWPLSAGQSMKAQGSDELGEVVLSAGSPK
ncbi:DUF2271 domain-containing protein [Rhodopirellula sallentina]|uniref:DUF2271 domain-containing protein n=1 Tax=Rhodopirellula sallentina SM41 TaxID=1263870 RepID=M5UK71_9BACT|nr:DUF2271 domain-containing protein [Rhodopirellula sallentina]EMI58241.1 hypothetical protein RSSM_00311 [Rhodopirellula sallentina SM41]